MWQTIDVRNDARINDKIFRNMWQTNFMERFIASDNTTGNITSSRPGPLVNAPVLSLKYKI